MERVPLLIRLNFTLFVLFFNLPYVFQSHTSSIRLKYEYQLCTPYYKYISRYKLVGYHTQN